MLKYVFIIEEQLLESVCNWSRCKICWPKKLRGWDSITPPPFDRLRVIFLLVAETRTALGTAIEAKFAKILRRVIPSKN